MHSFYTALRNLARLRFTGIAVLSLLTLGISANLVIFALVNAALLRPLPFDQPQRLVALQDELGGKSTGVSWGEIQQWERAPGLFEAAAAYYGRTYALTDRSGSGLKVVLSGMVTPGFFSVLDTQPLVGTSFSAHEGVAADPHVALLSYALWQSRYGGSARVLNATLLLNDVPYRILGVLPKAFAFPVNGETPSIYIPLTVDYCCKLSQRGLDGIARLAPGISLDTANRHLQTLAQRNAQTEGLLRFGSGAIPLQTFLSHSQRRTLLLLWLSVCALTLIAALNAGALLLARSLRDLRQYALKISFGARLSDLFREQIALAIVLAVISGVTALVVGIALLHALRLSTFFAALLGNARAASGSASNLDWRVFCFCAALSFAAAMSACTLPLTLLRGISIERLLRSHSSTASYRNGHTLRTTLITVQLALSVMLLSAVFSFGHSLYSVLHRSPGFQTQDIVMAGIGIPDARYDTDANMIDFHEQALASIRAIPGVQAAGFAAGVPVHPYKTRFALDGSPNMSLPVAQRPRVDVAIVSPSMFHILGLPLLRGRGFNSDDRLDAPYVAIVNQSFARRYLDAADPLKRGMRVQFYNGVSMQPFPHYSIIGIVADSRGVSIDKPPAPEMYLSTQQIPLDGGDYFLDTNRPASSLREELPAAIWRVDSTLQKVEPMPLQLYLGEGFSSSRATLDLTLGFAGVALLLAAIGLGTSISAAVFESTKEIGIRSALGESRGSIALRVLRLALIRTLLGTACGIAGAIALSRIAVFSLDPNLPFDFRVLPLVAALMLAIAGLVSILPARRALSVSPVEALRAE